MSRIKTVTLTGTGVTTPTILDYYANPFALGLGCVVTGSITYSVEGSYDDTAASGYSATTATWFTVTGFSSVTTNAEGALTWPRAAVRLHGTGTGSVVMSAFQPGPRP